jgi:hypothetical protein
MADNWNNAEYREWQEGCWEKLLPRFTDDFDANNRLKRVERLAAHIRAGADRGICRGFVYTEEEWASGCRMAGHEPGEGWISRPFNLPGSVATRAKVEQEREVKPEPVADVLDKWWDA